MLAGAQPAAAAPSFSQNPVLFVHGIEGSGSQFESQKMRFMSNGYPEAWVDELDYDSTRAVGDKSEVDAQIDAKVAALKKRTGKTKVDVIAHSLGTSVMYDYMTNGSMADQRRASIGRYVNVDGQASNPGVPTLALWAGRGAAGRSMDARRT
jgi:triacylglycerol esterase/lipase EstA (alpha/beta hydrolase family)